MKKTAPAANRFSETQYACRNGCAYTADNHKTALQRLPGWRFYYHFSFSITTFALKSKTMDIDKIVELLFFTLPAVVVGGVAYFFFKGFVQNEDNRRAFVLHKANRKDALPLRIQAYERMTLFMERIALNKLLLRVAPVSGDKQDYAQYLIAHIEQEFEHNLAQQIYLSEDCWTILLTAKNTTIQIIRNAANNEKVSDADALRESVLIGLTERESPSMAALAFIKNEVREMLL